MEEIVTRLRAAGCVFAEDEARLLIAESRSEELEPRVQRRIAGEPLEQVLGWAEFAGLRVRVEPGVFVPRRRSELLVRQSLEVLRTGDLVVELCCGAGAVSVALLDAVDLELYAVDIDRAAVACAARNLDGRGTALGGDLYAALPEPIRGRVRLVVANAPYVPTAEIAHMPTEARDHEPRVALDGGADGTDLQRRVVAGATDWLASDGMLIIETSRAQAPEIYAAMRSAGLTPRIEVADDVDGTCVVGTALSHM